MPWQAPEAAQQIGSARNTDHGETRLWINYLIGRLRPPLRLSDEHANPVLTDGSDTRDLTGGNLFTMFLSPAPDGCGIVVRETIRRRT
jgi:hypothetical protein